MLGLIQALFEKTLYGVLTIMCVMILYIWREQGIIKAENKKDVEKLHEKKLDKQDFREYKDDHEAEHKSHGKYFEMIITLLKGGR